MVDAAASSSAARKAGEDYQIIVRTLDLLASCEGEDVSEGFLSLSDHEIDAILSPSRRGRGVRGARELVGDFLRAQEYVVETSPTVGHPRISGLKRRALVEYMHVISDLAEQNRKVRASQYVEPRMGDVIGKAMTVTPMVQGRSRGPVIRAAVLYKGFAWSMPAPARHSDVLNTMFDMLGGAVDGLQTDGFLTASGHFVDRIEGLKTARGARQPFMEEPRSSELFSENLW